MYFWKTPAFTTRSSGCGATRRPSRSTIRETTCPGGPLVLRALEVRASVGCLSVRHRRKEGGRDAQGPARILQKAACRKGAAADPRGRPARPIRKGRRGGLGKGKRRAREHAINPARLVF